MEKLAGLFGGLKSLFGGDGGGLLAGITGDSSGGCPSCGKSGCSGGCCGGGCA